jgi:hypothetical protein
VNSSPVSGTIAPSRRTAINECAIEYFESPTASVDSPAASLSARSVTIGTNFFKSAPTQ